LIGENIDAVWKPGANLWPVKMDLAQINQILANLVINARDAIADVGIVTIETAKAEFDEKYCRTHADVVPGEYVSLAVSDDGCGMDQATLARLFEPFFTTKEVGQGTGLGLATVYGIVKQNNGFVNVYSEPGEGSTFRIYLPRYVAEEQETKEPCAAVAAHTGSETVLLVEDEKVLLDLAERLLNELGYTVLAADTPGEALRLAEEHGDVIHLLVSDVIMPEMNGRELWRQLRALRPGLKALFASGYTANVIAHHGVLDEGVQFISKPFSREALAAALRQALSDE
jgi:two-component system, cell cycle sensor histidine kinase and response regulator CckA